MSLSNLHQVVEECVGVDVEVAWGTESGLGQTGKKRASLVEMVSRTKERH